jgi:hypothetical protein
MVQHFDVTRRVGAEASGLSREVRAQFDDIASERLAMVQTGSLFITDVRKLPDDAGFLGAKYQDFSFITILDDGFVVSTDAMIGRPGISRRLQRLGLSRLDPGCVALFVSDVAQANRMHVDRVAQFWSARACSIRKPHDLDLYFEFRRKRSSQIRRRSELQIIPWLALQPFAAILLVATVRARFPHGKPPLSLFLGVFLLSAATLLLSLVLGAFADIALRGSKPMLPPS